MRTPYVIAAEALSQPVRLPKTTSGGGTISVPRWTKVVQIARRWREQVNAGDARTITMGCNGVSCTRLSNH